MNIIEAINSGKATIVDVRSGEEFSMGHIKGSLNIPLPEVSSRMAEFRSMEQPILLVCASGNRSGMATMMLQREGIDCHNAGGWADLDYQMSRLKAF